MTKEASATTASRRGRAAPGKPASRASVAKPAGAAAKKAPREAPRPAGKAAAKKKPSPAPKGAAKRATTAASAQAKTASARGNAAPVRSRATKAGPGLIATLAGISSAALAKATGYGWDYWLKVLDKAGAAKLPHREIARMLYDKLGLRKNRWAQMIAFGYEQARGLRKPNQGAHGFAATVTRTIAVPVSALYSAWEEGLRGDWLPDALEVRRATKNKSMRITWPDGSGVDVNFYAKGGEKTVVAIEQTKLPDEGAVEAVKQLWGATLDRLKSTLESR